MKLLPALLLFLVFCTGTAGAGDEVQINEQLQNGGAVHLQSGIYNIEGSIKIHSNTVFGCGAKIIFLQFDTIFFTLMCHFLPNEMN